MDFYLTTSVSTFPCFRSPSHSQNNKVIIFLNEYIIFRAFLYDCPGERTPIMLTTFRADSRNEGVIL